ncbi:MAG: glutamate--cysteine ligase [Pseudomonadota bacterium]
MVPHLVTALTGPINELEQRILDSMPAIERWFRLEWMEHTPPFYSAVDVRNAGFKLAPVDTALFPDGWNILTPAMLPLAVQAAQAAIEKICPEARNLLIVPENQARSTFYLSNLAQMRRVFHMAGLNVRIGSIDPELKKSVTLDLPNGETITLEPVVRNKGRIGVKDFDPCTILLNNNLSAGVPGILEDLPQQYLLPPLHAGWSNRRKSTHFKCFEEVSKRFGKLIGVDHWLIHPMFDKCPQIDFSSDADVQTLATHVESLLGKIRKKHKEYGIKEKPFVVLKSDNGDLRMGVLTLRDGKDLEAVRQQVLRNAGETATTGGEAVFDVLLQEGVLTCERVNDAVAEPVVYMMDRYVVGGFYRVHPQRKVDENLNAPGSSYVPLAFAESTHLPQPGVKPGASAPNRFYMYGVIARLAMLAASYELEATDPHAERYD